MFAYILMVHSILGTEFVYLRGDSTEDPSQGSQLSLLYTHRRNKIYQDLKQHFWWNAMKREIAQYMAKCLVCQQVKAEHQKPARLLQPLPIPEWKWEHVTIDFVTALPRSPKGNNAVCC